MSEGTDREERKERSLMRLDLEKRSQSTARMDVCLWPEGIS